MKRKKKVITLDKSYLKRIASIYSIEDKKALYCIDKTIKKLKLQMTREEISEIIYEMTKHTKIGLINPPVFKA
jgi:hypothetical protein